jgi:hypothetical protein
LRTTLYLHLPERSQSPVTAVVYLASMAVINGARTYGQVKQVVQMGFGNVIKVRILVRL